MLSLPLYISDCPHLSITTFPSTFSIRRFDTSSDSPNLWTSNESPFFYQTNFISRWKPLWGYWSPPTSQINHLPPVHIRLLLSSLVWWYPPISRYHPIAIWNSLKIRFIRAPVYAHPSSLQDLILYQLPETGSLRDKELLHLGRNIVCRISDILVFLVFYFKEASQPW